MSPLVAYYRVSTQKQALRRDIGASKPDSLIDRRGAILKLKSFFGRGGQHGEHDRQWFRLLVSNRKSHRKLLQPNDEIWYVDSLFLMDASI